MDYYYDHDTQLEKSKKEAIIKKLRDEVDEMKVKYCLKDKIEKQSYDDPVKVNRLNDDFRNVSHSNRLSIQEQNKNLNCNTFNYNNLDPNSDIFKTKYKVIDYNKFNSEEQYMEGEVDNEINQEFNEDIVNDGEDEIEEEPYASNIVRTTRNMENSNNEFIEDKIQTLENEASNINKYNFTKPIMGNCKIIEKPNTSNLINNKYYKKDLYSEYRKELNEYVSQNNEKQRPKTSMPDGNMKRAKSARNVINKEKKKNIDNKSIEKGDYFKKMKNKYIPRYDKHEEKFEKLKSEIEEKFQKECSFNPKINTNFLSNKDKFESKDDLYKRLSTPKIVEVQKRQKENEIIELKKLSEVCTFKPKISENLINYQKKINTVGEVLPEDSNVEKVQDRLLRYAEEMKEKKEKLKQENQENLSKKYSFNPEINETSKQLMLKYGNTPLHERYHDIIKNRQENLQRLRLTMEKNNENTNYHPEINQKSKEIVYKKSENTDPYERLYSDAINKKTNKVIQHQDSDIDQCTFTPQLYYSNIQQSGNIEDFLERQKIYEEMKKEKLEKKLNKSTMENNENYTFTPKINVTSDILMRADAERANETSKEKYDRLSKKNFENIQKKKEQLESLHYAQFDFKPKINEISRLVARDSNLKDISYYKESSKIKEVRENKNRDEEDNCTFKPQINKDNRYYENVKSNYKRDDNIGERIKQEIKQKQEKIEEKKSFVENQNVKECKFKPEINETPNFEFKEPIMLKGFARHLEQMEKARKAKREKEEREKKVFITGENWSRDNLITVPKPFNLSHQTVDITKKQEELMRKKQELEMKDCTFKPNTNERKNKEMIKMILKN